MTIKEMETRSGLTRANIRFYEAEGLLTPQRRPNGYRDYSEEDLAELQRIKLLRTLHLTLEEIREVQQGQCSLAEALDRNLVRLASDQDQLARSEAVCRGMKGDGARYDTLDAPRYLAQLEQAAQDGTPELAADRLPRVQAPWRRYFARSLDLTLYRVLWCALFLALGFRVSGASLGWSLLLLVLSVTTMFLLEPVFLSRLGTTPGKAIWGLRVTDPDGGRLSYADAYQRTGLVLVRGMGLGIPIYQWVQNFKSYDACENGKELAWEADSVLVLKDKKPWRVLLWAAVLAALLGVVAALLLYAQFPNYRGELTVAQFCENYNHLAAENGIDNGYTLTKQGWKAKPQPDNVIVMADLMFDGPPEIAFQEENGSMTGLSFHMEGDMGTMVLREHRDIMSLAIIAFVCAQPEYRTELFNNQVDQLLEEISGQLFPSFDRTLFGVRILGRTQEDGEWITVDFSMEKTET